MPRTLGGRVEVWSATLTVAPISDIVDLVTHYGYRKGIAGELSDTSFEFDSRTATVTRMDVDVLGDFRFGIDIDFDPVADQEFIGQPGLPTLEPLWVHFCDKALDLADPSDVFTGGVQWPEYQTPKPSLFDWSSKTTIEVVLSKKVNSTATGNPSVTGMAEFRSTLTADTGTIADTNGLDDAVYSYQWVRMEMGAATDIPDATGTTYTLTSADIGKSIKVVSTFVDDDGYSETRSSRLVGPVTALVCSKPALGRRTEVWSATLTVEPISDIVDLVTHYGYREGIAGELSDTSFEFDSRTATVTRMDVGALRRLQIWDRHRL